jgi:hypothetical protein
VSGHVHKEPAVTQGGDELPRAPEIARHGVAPVGPGSRRIANEGPNAVPGLGQGPGDVAPDEAGGARYEDLVTRHGDIVESGVGGTARGT